MKKYYLLLTLFSFVSLFAQSLENEMTDVVNAERKSASKRMNLVTNPNTDNYDIIYHRLKFTELMMCPSLIILYKTCLKNFLLVCCCI